MPGAGERPHFYAWSPTGERLLASFSSISPRQSSRLALFNAHTGELLSNIWQGNDLPAPVGWLGTSATVAGFGDPLVFNAAGDRQARIPLGGAVLSKLEATADEKRLIAVDMNRSVALIDSLDWRILDRLTGPWLHAAITPDGGLVALLEPWGKLHLLRVNNEHFEPIGVVPIPADAVALALTPGELITAGGGQCHRSRLIVG
jgi:hypothetical protein